MATATKLKDVRRPPAFARKWLARFEAEGIAGFRDRSSRPEKLHKPTQEPVVKRIIALRREGWTGKHIACETGISPATVSRVLKRAGLSRLKDLELAEPVRHDERKAPGEMIHIDIKKLGRFERTCHRITGDRTGQSSHRVVGAFPDGKSCLNLAAAGLRHMAGSSWSAKRYLNMELLKKDKISATLTA